MNIKSMKYGILFLGLVFVTIKAAMPAHTGRDAMEIDQALFVDDGASYDLALPVPQVAIAASAGPVYTRMSTVVAILEMLDHPNLKKSGLDVSLTRPIPIDFIKTVLRLVLHYKDRDASETYKFDDPVTDLSDADLANKNALAQEIFKALRKFAPKFHSDGRAGMGIGADEVFKMFWDSIDYLVGNYAHATLAVKDRKIVSPLSFTNRLDNLEIFLSNQVTAITPLRLDGVEDVNIPLLKELFTTAITAQSLRAHVIHNTPVPLNASFIETMTLGVLSKLEGLSFYPGKTKIRALNTLLENLKNREALEHCNRVIELFDKALGVPEGSSEKYDFAQCAQNNVNKFYKFYRNFVESLLDQENIVDFIDCKLASKAEVLSFIDASFNRFYNNAKSTAKGLNVKRAELLRLRDFCAQGSDPARVETPVVAVAAGAKAHVRGSAVHQNTEEVDRFKDAVLEKLKASRQLLLRDKTRLEGALGERTAALTLAEDRARSLEAKLGDTSSLATDYAASKERIKQLERENTEQAEGLRVRDGRIQESDRRVLMSKTVGSRTALGTAAVLAAATWYLGKDPQMFHAVAPVLFGTVAGAVTYAGDSLRSKYQSWNKVTK